MTSGYHLVGHRVRMISFSRRRVECECGEEFSIPEHELKLIEQESLAAVFRAHRREMTSKGVKADERQPNL